MKLEDMRTDWDNLYSLPPGLLSDVSRIVELELNDSEDLEGRLHLFSGFSENAFPKLKSIYLDEVALIPSEILALVIVNAEEAEVSGGTKEQLEVIIRKILDTEQLTLRELVLYRFEDWNSISAEDWEQADDKLEYLDFD